MIAEWFHGHAPAVLQRHGLLGATYWQLLLLPLAFLIGFGVSRLVTALMAFIALRIARLTRLRWDDMLINRLRAPTALLLTGVIGLLLQQPLQLPMRLHAKVSAFNTMLTLLAGFWALLRAVDILHHSMRGGAWIAHRPAAVPVLGLLVRAAKVAIFALGLITGLQQLGYPVAGLIAGLGVGGLAVALAAQKTLENLLGSVMLTVDQPMRTGDLIQVETVLGTVEEIGLRSTRVRTPGRTLVSIPNGKLADARIENLQSRERLQLNFVLNLHRGLPLATLASVIEEGRKVLALHPKTFKPDNAVHLQAIGEAAFQVEVNCWIVLAPKEDFRDVRQEIYFAMLRLLEQKGAALSYPTRAVHLEKS